MAKPKILLIKTGGTIAMKPNEKGEHEPCSDDYLSRIEGLEELADIDVLDLENIDSTNMETNDKASLTFAAKRGGTEGTGQKCMEQRKSRNRADIARAIYERAFKYDGFTIVHGTDTMPETAAALTYMLPDFRKPIVLTGAQRSIWLPRSDGRNNVYTGVQAATKDFGEVVIAFGNYVLRGTRALKIDEEGYDAFDTPDVAPLGRVTSLKEGIRLAEHRVKKGDFDPCIFTEFDTNIFNYAPISGATVDSPLELLASNKDIHGFLLGGFGAGNIPSRLFPFIGSALQNDKPVYIYTKCIIGAADMGIYSISAAALKAGAQPAGDMTLEALGQKFMYALGRAASEELEGEEGMRFVESIIKKPYNGDITVTERRK